MKKVVLFQMTEKVVIPKRFIYILLTSVIAICIFSFTIGKEIYAGKTESLYSFGLVHFSGYLFFLLMPVELAFLYYLPFYSDGVLIAVALCTAVVAQCIDYFIGRLIRPRRIIAIMGKKRLVKAEGYIQKYGLFTIFIFNLFPLSSPVIALVAGMIKFNCRQFLLVSISGLLLKYFLLSLCF